MEPVEEAGYYRPTAATLRYVRDPEREAGRVRRRFFLQFNCPECAEGMLLVGEATDDEYHHFDEHAGEEERGQLEVVYPKYLYPPVNLINVPQTAPASIRQALDEAAELFWVSGQAAANALRKAVECLMTAHGILGYDADDNFVPLHRRIVELSNFQGHIRTSRVC